MVVVHASVSLTAVDSSKSNR